METIEQKIKELEFTSEKDYNKYLTDSIDLLKKDLDYIRSNVKNNYSKQTKDDYSKQKEYK